MYGLLGWAGEHWPKRMAAKSTAVHHARQFARGSFLLSMGGAQWLVVRHHVTHAGWWIAANAVAWPIGVTVPVVGMTLIPDGAAAASMAAVGVLSGLLMGLIVGALTGVAFVFLVLPPDGHG